MLFRTLGSESLNSRDFYGRSGSECKEKIRNLNGKDPHSSVKKILIKREIRRKQVHKHFSFLVFFCKAPNFLLWKPLDLGIFFLAKPVEVLFGYWGNQLNQCSVFPGFFWELRLQEPELEHSFHYLPLSQIMCLALRMVSFFIFFP